jgi:hypothetical protein
VVFLAVSCLVFGFSRVSVVLLASNFVQILNCVMIQTLFEFQNLFIYKICSNSTFCSHIKNVQSQFFFHMHNLFKFVQIQNLFRFEICSILKFVQI